MNNKIKLYFFCGLLTAFVVGLLPSKAYAFVTLAIDPKSIILNVKSYFTKVMESETVVNTIKTVKKTSAAIGTAKKTVTEYVVENKKKIEQQLAMIDEYKKGVEEYQALYNEYKAKVEEGISTAKEIKEEVETGIDTAKDVIDNAPDAINNFKNDVSSQINDKISSVTDKVEGVLPTNNHKEAETPTADKLVKPSTPTLNNKNNNLPQQAVYTPAVYNPHQSESNKLASSSRKTFVDSNPPTSSVAVVSDTPPVVKTEASGNISPSVSSSKKQVFVSGGRDRTTSPRSSSESLPQTARSSIATTSPSVINRTPSVVTLGLNGSSNLSNSSIGTISSSKYNSFSDGGFANIPSQPFFGGGLSSSPLSQEGMANPAELEVLLKTLSEESGVQEEVTEEVTEQEDDAIEEVAEEEISEESDKKEDTSEDKLVEEEKDQPIFMKTNNTTNKLFEEAIVVQKNTNKSSNLSTKEMINE